MRLSFEYKLDFGTQKLDLLPITLFYTEFF